MIHFDLEFQTIEDCRKAVVFLADFIHHDLFFDCTLHDETFAFSILMNSLKCSNSRIKKLQDQIIREGLKLRRIPTASEITEQKEKELSSLIPAP